MGTTTELGGITDDLIKADIAGFKLRIGEARAKLAALPATANTWKDRKRLKARRQFLKDEIVHVQHMLDIATEALEQN